MARTAKLETAGQRFKKEIEDRAAKIRAVGGFVRIDDADGSNPKLVVDLGVRTRSGRRTQWLFEEEAMKFYLADAYRYSNVSPDDYFLWSFWKAKTHTLGADSLDEDLEEFERIDAKDRAAGAK